MAMRAVRGATQLAVDDPAHMSERVGELIAEMIAANSLTADDLISILFTATTDLTSDFPAVGAREAGLTDVPLICAQEIEVPGGLARAVRLMMHVDTDRSRQEIVHVYLHGAAALRPDLVRDHD